MCEGERERERESQRKCSSCSGNTGTKKKHCYFGSVDLRLTDGSELYMLWMRWVGVDGWLVR